MLHDANSLFKLAGVVAGTALAQSSSILGVVPMWAGDVKEWGGIIAILAGVFATVGIGVGQWLKNIRVMQEIKAQQRRDLQEIQRKTEDAICMRRRNYKSCPLFAQQLIPEHSQPESHDRSHEHDNDRD